jgi:hypothetical protein
VAVLGAVAGRTRAYQSEGVAHLAAKQLHDHFKTKHKAICCRVLTRSVEWGSAQHKTLCEQYVIDAATITDEILKAYLLEFLPQGGGKTIPKKNFLKNWFVKISRKNSSQNSDGQSA